jgi:tetratricopeptide (TPR) repeat protein
MANSFPPLTRTLRWGIAVWALGALSLFAQDSTAPVAQPLAPPTDNSQPPVAQPASSPVAPPVALPADGADTNTAPEPGADLIVVNPAEARFSAAMSSYSAGQYADAVGALSQFIADFPQDRHREEALYRLADSYRILKHADDALQAYAYQVENYPDGLFRVDAEMQRGAIQFDEQKYADAIPPLQYVSDKGDGALQLAANYLLGRAFLQTQKELQGRALLEPIADATPPNKFSGDAAQTLAVLDDSQGKYADAYPLWQKAVAQATDPSVKATAAARGGWSAMEAKKLDDAESLFRIARTADAPVEARKVANTGLLHLLFARKHYSEWLKVYDEATTSHGAELIDSAREEILYDHGQAEFALKHWKEAVAAFDAYLTAYPTSDSAAIAAYQRFLADTQVEPTRAPAEGDAYLKSWPKSPYRTQVQLLQAQELSHEKKFADAVPLWENLANEPAKADWPHDQILLELARSYDELGNFPKAATAYQTYMDALSSRPKPSDAQEQKKLTSQMLAAQSRLAVCLQKSDQLLAATNAWNVVLSLASDGSPEQETALESLALIYARGGPNQAAQMVDTFHKILDIFPNSPLRAMAAFTVGNDLFAKRDYAGAERLLLNARSWDAKTWEQPATQRLVLAAFGMKNYDATVGYLNEYDTVPVPADPQAALAARLPAALFYWLAEAARQSGKQPDAEAYYLRVIRSPDPGNLLAGAWWELGEVQSARKEWAQAVSSYENYRGLKPDAKDATTVLLALGRARLGSGDFDTAKKIGDQITLQEPEGQHNAEGRMLLGETAFNRGDFPEAAKQFDLVATLFDDPKITPQAEARAADAFDRVGDAKSAAKCRDKLKSAYPQFQETAYL